MKEALLFFLASFSLNSSNLNDWEKSNQNLEWEESYEGFRVGPIEKVLDQEILKFHSQYPEITIKYLRIEKMKGEFYQLTIAPQAGRENELRVINGLKGIANWFDEDDPVRFYCGNRKDVNYILESLKNRTLINQFMVDQIKRFLNI